MANKEKMRKALGFLAYLGIGMAFVIGSIVSLVGKTMNVNSGAAIVNIIIVVVITSFALVALSVHIKKLLA